MWLGNINIFEGYTEHNLSPMCSRTTLCKAKKNKK